MKRVIIAVMTAAILISGCGAANQMQEGRADDGTMAMADQGVPKKEDKGNAAQFSGKADKTYTADYEKVTVSFSSQSGLLELEPIETMGIVHQSFYTKDASHSIDVGYVPAKYNQPGDPKTGQEFASYPWNDTVTPLTEIKTEDISIDGWSGFYYEYHDKSMDFDASGYVFYNEAGDEVSLSQTKRGNIYLPIENISIK